MEFFIHLEGRNYGPAGWAVPAATLPGAQLKRLLINGAPQDLDNDWQLEGGHLRQRSGVPPAGNAELLIKLRSKLVTVRIPVIASVVSALIGAGASVFTKSCSGPPPCSGPSCVETRITLGELVDEDQRPIKKDAAPFKVFTSGTVSNGEGLVACLVVDDQNREWVEPGCRKVVGNRFSGILFLGEKDSQDSLGKQYKLFAVLSKSSLGEYQILDRGQVITMSEVVAVRRTR